MRSCRCTVAGLATLAAVGGMMLTSGVAVAARGLGYQSRFTVAGTAMAVAVDGSSNVFVATTNSVERFSPAGVPVAFSAGGSYVEGAKLTGDENGTFQNVLGVAVDDATGHVYVADAARGVVDVFSSTGEYLSQLTGTPPTASVHGSFAGPQGLTVDQSTHGLYVADPGNGVIDVFDSAGAYVRQVGKGEFGPYGETVAVNELTKTLYVGNSGPELIDLYDGEGSFLEPAWSGTNAQVGSFKGFVYVGLDPSNGRVFVADTSHRVVSEFSSSLTEEYEGQLVGTPEGPFSRPSAIATDPANGNVYIADQGGGESTIDVFVRGAAFEQPVTEGATVFRDTAVLHGELNPLANAKVGWYFAYNKGNSCKGGIRTPVEAQVEGQAVKESKLIAGLEPGTKYTFCMVAELFVSPEYGSSGLEYGSPSSFETEPLPQPPAVLTGRAQGTTQTGTTLVGTVNPNSGAGPWPTVYYYQYGTIGYTQRTQVSEAGEGNTPVPALATIGDLEPGTAYHYRLVAESAGGVTYGTDQQFTTLPGPPPVQGEENVIQNPVLPGIVIAALPEPPAQPLLALPLITFPTEAGTTTHKTLTNAQKLANALRVCHAKHNREKRITCEKRAHKRYPSTKKRRGKK